MPNKTFYSEDRLESLAGLETEIRVCSFANGINAKLFLTVPKYVSFMSKIKEINCPERLTLNTVQA